MSFNNISVDIETTGTDASHAAMIQLAAVRFDLETKEIDMNMFNMSLAVPGNRFWQENTREWWATQDPTILDRIYATMREPRAVLRDFAEWATQGLDGERPVIWSKPSHFEWPFLQSYFTQFDVPIPFRYNEANDLNSWCRARGMPKLDKETPFDGDEHDAIYDCLHQINVLFKLMEMTDVVHNAG